MEQKDYQAELERRRNRGRLAQSAFRKRQTQAKQEMLEENARLKQAIAAIQRELSEDDHPALRDKIQEAAKLAGLAIEETESSSRHPPNTSSSVQVQAAEVGKADSVSSSAEDSSSNSRSNQLLLSQTSRIAAGSDQLTIHRDPFHCHRCVNGVATVLPFLGPGAFTFAGRIFWRLVEKLEAVKQSDGSLQLPEPPFAVQLKPVPKFLELLEESATLQHLEPSQWISLVEERLASRRNGIALNESVGLHSQRPPAARGTRPLDKTFSQWLSPQSAEQRMRVIVGDEVFAALAAPELDRWESKMISGEGQNGAELIDGFFDILSESYICFGDGPRWNSESFDVALRNWCLSIIDTDGPSRLGQIIEVC